MTDLRLLLNRLERPRLLIRAARYGLSDYRRERDLSRLIGSRSLPPPDVSVTRLLQEEADLETIRQDGDASYSIARHIEVLIALMGEARLLPRSA